MRKDELMFCGYLIIEDKKSLPWKLFKTVICINSRITTAKQHYNAKSHSYSFLLLRFTVRL